MLPQQPPFGRIQHAAAVGQAACLRQQIPRQIQKQPGGMRARHFEGLREGIQHDLPGAHHTDLIARAVDPAALRRHGKAPMVKAIPTQAFGGAAIGPRGCLRLGQGKPTETPSRGLRLIAFRARGWAVMEQEAGIGLSPGIELLMRRQVAGRFM